MKTSRKRTAEKFAGEPPMDLSEQIVRFLLLTLAIAYAWLLLT